MMNKRSLGTDAGMSTDQASAAFGSNLSKRRRLTPTQHALKVDTAGDPAAKRSREAHDGGAVERCQRLPPPS